VTDHPFAAEAEIVKRATGLPDAIAGDLAVFGGILRCETCHGERPLGDIAGYLSSGWPQHCGKTMTWVTLKLLAAESREVPEGYELVAVPDDGWRVDPGRPCRRQGPRHRACGKPSAASLNRPQRLRATTYRPERRADSWWAYCTDHLYGRWVENGTVMVWVLREKSADD
jgi:hypothetical protein